MDFPVFAESSRVGGSGRKSVTVKNPDQNSIAYYIEIRGMECTVRRDGNHGSIVGKIGFDDFPAGLDIVFENNQREEMKKDGFRATTNAVNLPAAPELSPVKWRAAGASLDVVDAKGKEIAAFKKSYSPGSKIGTLRISDAGFSREVLDQIVITFIAMEEKRRRMRKNGRSSALCWGCIVSDAVPI